MAKIQPITKPKPEPEKPVPTLEQIINRAVGEGFGGEHMEKIADRLDALSEMLDDARDRSCTFKEDVEYLKDVSGGVQWLLFAIADDVRRLAAYPIELGKMAGEYRKATKGEAN